MSAPFPRGLYAIVSLDALGSRDPLEFAAEVLAGGAVALQLRAKTSPAREMLAVARRLVAACSEREVPLIVNDRVDVAIAAGAHGVHVGQEDLDTTEVRRQARGTSVRIVGLSTHDLGQVQAAVDAGQVDYLGFGPVFATRSKSRPKAPVGLAGVQAALQACPLPIVAIGGIGVPSAGEIAALGAHGVAVIDALASAQDPRGVARSFQEAFA